MLAKQSRSATTPTGEESTTPVFQPSGLGELATLTVTEPDKRLEAVQRAQISSLAGADKTKEPQDKTPKRQSPTLATRPKKYALEMWVEVETRVGMYTAPEEDSYSVDFAVDALNHAYPGCTSVYLGVAGHMLAFYSKKTNPKAGLPHDQAIVARKAIIDIPTWMGYFARWRVRCGSISEASEIVAGCKRLEKENWRWARWELQNRISVMQVDSTLSATARPFQPQATLQSSREDDGPQVHPPRSGWAGNCPTSGLLVDTPRRGTSLTHPHSSDDDGMSSDASNQDRPPPTGGVEVEGFEVTEVVVTPMIPTPLEGGEGRRMDFLVRSKSPNLVARKDILMMWPMPLGSGLAVSLITVIIIRTPTSCPWQCLP